MRLLFLTTTNLTTNPRLLKEVKLAMANGFQATVVLFDFDNWTKGIEKGLRESLREVEFIPINATRKSFINWFLASVLQIMYRWLYNYLPFSVEVDAYASDKRSFLLKRAIKRLAPNYDLIIGHNLGALYPAYAFGKEAVAPFAFDVEDYHPGETISIDSDSEVKRRERLMKELLPKASYVSYASPLIGKAILYLIPILSKQKHFLINNTFSAIEFLMPIIHNDKKLRLVWFSQNIAAGRGLELVVPTLYKYKEWVDLTLIGSLSSRFYQEFLSTFDNFINYQEPLDQVELHKLLSKFDIGLAIDLNSADFNRDICLTNKMFAYAQAGIYILATDTKAQSLFIEQNPSLGVIFRQFEHNFELVLRDLLQNKDELISTKKFRFALGNKLAWENEALKLVEVWKSFRTDDL